MAVPVELLPVLPDHDVGVASSAAVHGNQLATAQDGQLHSEVGAGLQHSELLFILEVLKCIIFIKADDILLELHYYLQPHPPWSPLLDPFFFQGFRWPWILFSIKGLCPVELVLVQEFIDDFENCE